MDKDILSGGREGVVFRQGDCVTRPANPWTKHVQDFLRFLHDKGADYVPIPYGFNEVGEEVLSYVKGQVYNEGLPGELQTDEFLQSAAGMLADFHTYGRQYIADLTGAETWMLSAVTPIEVMCHGDFAPYNVTVIDGKAVGIIDFDTLHPGPTMWDVAYAVYRFVGFMSQDNPECIGSLEEQIRRTNVFLSAYGATGEQKLQLLPMMIKRIDTLVTYMRWEAAKGNPDVISNNIERGDLNLYLEDIKYLKNYETDILRKLKSE